MEWSSAKVMRGRRKKKRRGKGKGGGKGKMVEGRNKNRGRRRRKCGLRENGEVINGIKKIKNRIRRVEKERGRGERTVDGMEEESGNKKRGMMEGLVRRR